MTSAARLRQMAQHPAEEGINSGHEALKSLREQVKAMTGSETLAERDTKSSQNASIDVPLTGPSTGAPSDAVRLYSLAKVEINTPFAFVCKYQTPEACANAGARAYLTKYQDSGFDLTVAARSIGHCSNKVHLEPLMTNDTLPHLGDCSFFNQCQKIWNGCKFVHLRRVAPRDSLAVIGVQMLKATKFKDDPHSFDKLTVTEKHAELVKLAAVQKVWRAMGPTIPSVPFGGLPKPIKPQFINCDIRRFDLTTLGDFAVVMADPPWPIHMTLPYGTITEEEILDIDVGTLSTAGLIFLWVTVRHMDLGRRCMKKWGYEMAGEVVWVKTNRLNRMIVTGRTGHWLNHAKETCFVGIKGPAPSPFEPFFGQDSDTIVAPVQDTSKKPHEICEMIDRLAGSDVRKVELFGRVGNLKSGWLTLGNQLPGSKGDFDIAEEEVRKRVEDFFKTDSAKA